jgi:hypothetical protein
MPSAVALKLQAAREWQSRARKGTERNLSGGNGDVDQQVGDSVTVAPEVADSHEDEVSSPSDDSDDIPPDVSNARTDPYEIGPTLRPSPDRRGAAHRASRKRGRDEMGLEENAPSTKRRQLSGDHAGSETDGRKGGTPAATAERVGSDVLNVLNQGAKRLQGVGKRTFTIDLPSKRKGKRSQQSAPDWSAGRQGGGQSLTSSWPSVREETLEEEEEVEKEAGEAMSEPMVVVEESDQEGEAEDQVIDEMGLAGIQDGGKEVTVPQLLEPPTPKQTKPARKSKPRKPKTAFEDRPPAEEAIPVIPRIHPKHPRSKQPVQQSKEVDTTEHIRQLFRDDTLSRVRRRQRQDDINEPSEPDVEAPHGKYEKGEEDILADEGRDDDELDEEEEALSVNTNSRGHSVTVPSIIAPTRDTAAVPGTQGASIGPHSRIPLVKVRSMMMDMASKNWTGGGKRWMEDKLDKVSFDGPVNATVQECYECLVNVRRRWAKAPRHPNLGKQHLFAQQESEATRKDTETILSLILEICKQLVQEKDRTSRETLQKEVIEFIVPWLIMLLRQFALLGGSTEKIDGQRQLPDVGTFSEPAVQLLAHVCRWLLHIHSSLARNIDLELEAWAENRRPSIFSTRVQVAEKQLRLNSAITAFKDQVRKALVYFKDIREEPIRRAKIAKREAEIRLKKEQEEEAERKRRQARAEAMRKSNERLRQAPDPLVEKWYRKVQGEEQITRFIASQQLAPVQRQEVVQQQQPAVQRKAAQRDEYDGYFSSPLGSPQLGGGLSAPRQPSDLVHRRQHEANPTRQLARSSSPLSLDDDGHSVAGPSTRKWDPEEDEFLIAELKSHSGDPLRPKDFRLWAQVLDREVSEIQLEVTRLKAATRTVVELRRMRIPPWAEMPDP